MRQNYGGLPRNPPLLTNTVAALTLAATRLISSRHSLPDTTPQHQQPCPTPHLSVSAASPPTSKPKPPTVPSSSTSSLATNGSFSSPTLKTTLLYVTLDQSHGPCLAIFYLKSRTSHRAKVSKQQLTPWSLPTGLHDRTRRICQARARIHKARRQAHRTQRKHH